MHRYTVVTVPGVRELICFWDVAGTVLFLSLGRGISRRGLLVRDKTASVLERAWVVLVPALQRSILLASS